MWVAARGEPRPRRSPSHGKQRLRGDAQTSHLPVRSVAPARDSLAGFSWRWISYPSDKKLRHVINNASGTLRPLVERLLKDRLPPNEFEEFLTLIY